MDLFTLKIIGIISMFLDHYSYIVKSNEIFDILGRIAFPIFAFALVEGYKHTSNIYKYFFRIGISAILFQIPIWILKYDVPLNIFFTLFLGLLCIHIFDKFDNIDTHLKRILVLPIIILALILNIDYGAYGIVLIMCFYMGNDNKFIRIVAPLLITIFFYFNHSKLWGMGKIQIYSILALIPIYFYNGKKGKNIKYFFYLFYPVHFLILEFIKYIIK